MGEENFAEMFEASLNGGRGAPVKEGEIVKAPRTSGPSGLRGHRNG